MQIHLTVFKYKYKYISGNMSFDQLLNTPIVHHQGWVQFHMELGIEVINSNYTGIGIGIEIIFNARIGIGIEYFLEK